MESRAGKSYRPEHITNWLLAIITWTATGWMILDTSFTIARAYDAFRPPNTLVRIFVAIAFGCACGFAQKVLFEVFVHSHKRKAWVLSSWNDGVMGKIFIFLVCSTAIYLIHFSWMATGNSLGITKGTFAIPNMGVKELASTAIYLTNIVSGLFIAFIDEILFLFAQILKD